MEHVSDKTKAEKTEKTEKIETKTDKKNKSIPFHHFIGIVHLPPCPNGCGNMVSEVKRKVVSKQPVDLDAPMDEQTKQTVKEATCEYLCQHCQESFYIKVQFIDENRLVA